MKFNFDELTQRRHTNSYKWDSGNNEDVIPLWVADMDFKTAPPIIEALKERVEQGIFGYTKVPEEYYQATKDWFEKRHNWKIEPDHIIYTSGVVPAISAIIKALTKPGHKVIVQTPVYNCFFSSIRNNGCIVSENELIYRDETYFMDFDDLEQKAKDPLAKVMLLCNPHNPAGRVWTRDELERVGQICIENNVIVVSDEIHCELVYQPYTYIPFASLNDNLTAQSVACVSPSKAFNIAGLQIANIVCRDGDIRKRIDKAININEVCDVNPFGVLATIAAYRKGEDWLNSLIQYLWGNYIFLKNFFKTELSDLKVLKLEGTYLAWVDCRSLGMPSEELEHRLLKESKVWINAGDMYGKAGEGFIRINMATPRERLEEGLNRLKSGLNGFYR